MTISACLKAPQFYSGKFFIQKKDNYWATNS